MSGSSSGVNAFRKSLRKAVDMLVPSRLRTPNKHPEIPLSYLWTPESTRTRPRTTPTTTPSWVISSLFGRSGAEKISTEAESEASRTPTGSSTGGGGVTTSSNDKKEPSSESSLAASSRSTSFFPFQSWFASAAGAIAPQHFHPPSTLSQDEDHLLESARASTAISKSTGSSGSGGPGHSGGGGGGEKKPTKKPRKRTNQEKDEDGLDSTLETSSIARGQPLEERKKGFLDALRNVGLLRPAEALSSSPGPPGGALLGVLGNTRGITFFVPEPESVSSLSDEADSRRREPLHRQQHSWAAHITAADGQHPASNISTPSSSHSSSSSPPPPTYPYNQPSPSPLPSSLRFSFIWNEIDAEISAVFTDATVPKVYENYSWHRFHIEKELGITNLAGLHADTMHMARLSGGSSCVSTTPAAASATSAGEVEQVENLQMSEQDDINKEKITGGSSSSASSASCSTSSTFTTTSTPRNNKTTTTSSNKDVLQRFSTLKRELQGINCRGESFYELYREYWLDFADVLAEIESRGVGINVEKLETITKDAMKDRDEAERRFRQWVFDTMAKKRQECVDDYPEVKAHLLQLSSTKQVMQLLFGGWESERDPVNKSLPEFETFTVEAEFFTEAEVEEARIEAKASAEEMKKLGHELEEFLEALAEHDEVAVGAAELEGKQEDNGRKGGGRKRRRKIIEQDAEKVVHELNHLEGGTQVSTSAASFSTTAPLSTSTSPTTNTTSSDVSPPMFPRITEDRLKELKVGELRLWLDVLRGFSNDFKPRSKLTKADLIKELLRLEEIVIAAQDKAARIKIGDRTTQEIVIPGFGLTPTALTQKGWPSVSRESLLAVAKQATKDAETATISADRDEDVELEYNKKKGQDQDDDEEASSSSEQGLPTRTSPPPFDPSLTDWLENNGILQGFMLPLANYAKSYTKRGTSTGGGSTSSSTSSSSTSSSSTSSSTSSSKDDRAREIPRIFMNLNLYTETGRLACRHPNLQNVPTATRKYNLRECFSAAPGKTFVIVDYSQLELRVLAHLTSCRSMLDGFLRGGDFHSRTAMNMFPHIKEEYERRSREKRLTTSTGGGDHSTTSSINSSSFSSSSSTTEGSHEQDEDDIAFVKEKYPVERKKAKTLNFSVVYGATKHGLAKTLQLEGGTEEAQQIIDLWYKNFPEVLKWQQQTVEHATRYGYVETLLGRRRWIPDMMAPYKGSSGAGLLSAWGRSANRAGIPVTSPLYSAAAAGDHQGQGYSNNNSANSSPFGTPWRGPISWQRRKHLERVCSNTPVQGSAADVVTSAMIQLHKSKLLHDLGFVQVLQVHDELVLEGPKEHAEEARAEVVRLAENAQVGMMLKLQCPLLVDSKISETWC